MSLISLPVKARPTTAWFINDNTIADQIRSERIYCAQKQQRGGIAETAAIRFFVIERHFGCNQEFVDPLDGQRPNIVMNCHYVLAARESSTHLHAHFTLEVLLKHSRRFPPTRGASGRV
jgi:hypothetical protein